MLLKHPRARVEAVLGKSLNTADQDGITVADVARLTVAFPTLAYSDVVIAEWARLPECCDTCALTEDACSDAWCGCHGERSHV